MIMVTNNECLRIYEIMLNKLKLNICKIQKSKIATSEIFKVLVYLFHKNKTKFSMWENMLLTIYR